MSNQKNSSTLELDFVEYAKYEGKIPAIISNSMQKVFLYSPKFQEIKKKLPVNLISDATPLGKAIIDDNRVSNVVDLFPSIVNLYKEQKDLMKSVYFSIHKASNDNKKIVKLPIKPQKPRPIEVKPDEKVVVPFKPKKESSNSIAYGVQQPIKYSVQIPVFHSNSYSNLESKLDLSMNGMYYRR